MEQTYRHLTQNLEHENENSKLDNGDTLFKVDLKPPLTQSQKLPDERQENANQDGHIVEIKSENQAQNEQSQNAFSIEETIDIKLENEETR